MSASALPNPPKCSVVPSCHFLTLSCHSQWNVATAEVSTLACWLHLDLDCLHNVTGLAGLSLGIPFQSNHFFFQLPPDNLYVFSGPHNLSVFSGPLWGAFRVFSGPHSHVLNCLMCSTGQEQVWIVCWVPSLQQWSPPGCLFSLWSISCALLHMVRYHRMELKERREFFLLVCTQTHLQDCTVLLCTYMHDLPKDVLLCFLNEAPY